MQTLSSGSNLAGGTVIPGLLDRNQFGTGNFGDDFTNADQPPRPDFSGRSRTDVLLDCSNDRRSGDQQIVSTVANTTLAGARAGGSPSAYKQLLVRYATVQGVVLFALGRDRSQLPSWQRGRSLLRLLHGLPSSSVVRGSAIARSDLCSLSFIITSVCSFERAGWRI